MDFGGFFEAATAQAEAGGQRPYPYQRVLDRRTRDAALPGPPETVGGFLDLRAGGHP